MPFNRRLRTLCTLRSSFATTCGTSAPQGRERGGQGTAPRRSIVGRRTQGVRPPLSRRSAASQPRRKGDGVGRRILASNRRLRTLCTLRSSFTTTCGTSAPQGCEWGHHTSALNRRAPHARRGTLLGQTTLRHLSHAGARASWRLQLRLPLGGRFFLLNWHEKTCVY